MIESLIIVQFVRIKQSAMHSYYTNLFLFLEANVGSTEMGKWIG